MWHSIDHPSNQQFFLKRMFSQDFRSTATNNLFYKRLISYGFRPEFAAEFCM